MVQISNYDGKQLSSFKVSPNFMLSSSGMSISNEFVTFRDISDEKSVHVFDIQSGKACSQGSVKHSSEVLVFQLLSQHKGYLAAAEMALLIDKNNDLFLVELHLRQTKRLAGSTTSAVWHQEYPMIASVSDGKLCVWYYPYSVFLDADLVPLACSTKDLICGTEFELSGFAQGCCVSKTSNGSTVHSSASIDGYLSLVHQFFGKKQWEQMIRLCRHAESKQLWACVAGMAIHAEDLNTAEVAYAAIEELRKVKNICSIRDIPNRDVRNAELALFKKQHDIAENILLSKNLPFKAITMWLELFKWDKALDLALKHSSQYLDIVLFLRQRYLASMGMKETNTKFIEASKTVSFDEETTRQKIQDVQIREMQLAVR